MILIGSTHSPLRVLSQFQSEKIPVSVNVFDANYTAVFTSVQDFVKLRTPSIDKTIIVCDCREKLVSLKGITILNKISSQDIKRVKPIDSTSIVRQDWVRDEIEKHKALGILDIYNTNLYRIAPEPRKLVKKIFLDYLAGTTDQASFRKSLAVFNERGKLGEAVAKLIDLSYTKDFANLALAIQDVIRGKSVETAAQQHSVDTFEIRYIISSLKKDA